MIKRNVIICGNIIAGATLITGVAVGCGLSKRKSAAGSSIGGNPSKPASSKGKNTSSHKSSISDQPTEDEYLVDVTSITEKLETKKKAMQGKCYDIKEVEAIRKEFKGYLDEMRTVLTKAKANGSIADVTDSIVRGCMKCSEECNWVEKLKDELEVAENSREQVANILLGTENCDFSDAFKVVTAAFSWISILCNLQSEAEKYVSNSFGCRYFNIESQAIWNFEGIRNLQIERGRWINLAQDYRQRHLDHIACVLDVLGTLTDLYLQLSHQLEVVFFDGGQKTILETITNLCNEELRVFSDMRNHYGGAPERYEYDRLYCVFDNFRNTNIRDHYSPYGMVEPRHQIEEAEALE